MIGKMDFIDVETFLAVADSRNLTKAAENLYVSQSTITHRLKKLEEELQYKLFLRQKGKRSIELTARGEEFMSIARRWIALYQEMELLKSSVSKSLAIASVDSVVLMVLPAILQEISKKEYGINVSVQTEHSPKIYDLVRSREADIGFVSADASIPEIETRPVFGQKYVLIKPDKSPGEIRQIHPSELDPACEIFEPWGYDYMKWHDYWWPTKTPHIKIDSLMALTPFLDNENYWAIVPVSSLKTVLGKYSVQIYEIQDGPPERVYYMIKHKYPNKQNLAGIRTFEKIMDAYLTKTDLFQME